MPERRPVQAGVRAGERPAPNDKGGGPDADSTERVTDPAQSAEVGQHLHAGQVRGTTCGSVAGSYVGGGQSSRAARRAANREAPARCSRSVSSQEVTGGRVLVAASPAQASTTTRECRCSSPTR